MIQPFSSRRKDHSFLRGFVFFPTLLGIGECRENRQQLRCGNVPHSFTGFAKTRASQSV